MNNYYTRGSGGITKKFCLDSSLESILLIVNYQTNAFLIKNVLFCILLPIKFIISCQNRTLIVPNHGQTSPRSPIAFLMKISSKTKYLPSKLLIIRLKASSSSSKWCRKKITIMRWMSKSRSGFRLELKEVTSFRKSERQSGKLDTIMVYAPIATILSISMVVSMFLQTLTI